MFAGPHLFCVLSNLPTFSKRYCGIKKNCFVVTPKELCFVAGGSHMWIFCCGE